MSSLWPKKVVKIFLSIIRPHSRMCMIIYIFCFKNNTLTQKQKAKETKEEK